MNKAMLIILDGWGIGDCSSADGISQANTPIFDQLLKSNPTSTLKTFGDNVGLPDGQMGNSEVGHLNIGAGRVVYQDLLRINKEIDTDKLRTNTVLQTAIEYAKSNNSAVHLMGLLSHGGVHSSQKHLHYIIDILEESACSKIFVHGFTDGRDVEPKSAHLNIAELYAHIQGKKTQLGSIIGRFYGMDRDNRWERIKEAFDLLIHRKGIETNDFVDYAHSQYEKGITDEFFEAACNAEVDARINPNDVVICFNYRTDRCREITTVLTQKDMPEYEMSRIPLHYVTMTRYDEKFEDVHVLYEKDNLSMTLGEVLASVNAKQLRIAETEKYPHVTFFFSGGREKPFNGEIREVIASPKVATYDLQPEMSAEKVTNACINHIREDQPDFICLNFANPDMVGHTGVESAIIRALEMVDLSLGRVLAEAEKHGYSTLIIADHGNADIMHNADGSPHTAHTMNLVPCILVGANKRLVNGKLADVAPTILDLMQIAKPAEMTGQSLLQ